MANSIIVGEKELEIPEGWLIINAENQEEAFKEFPYLEQLGEFSLIILKSSNNEKYQRAVQNENGEEIVANYPAYIVIKQMEYDNSQSKNKIVSIPIEGLKKSVKQTYQNVIVQPEEKITVDGEPGYRMDYQVGHMDFKNMFYTIDDSNVVALISVSTIKQEANKEIENILNVIVQ